MRPTSIALCLIAAALALAAGPANAQPVTCGQVITEDTTLENDLECRGEDGIVIGAPGITLDLGGHTLSSWATNIRNDGYDDVTIENGTVILDGTGISLSGVTGNVVRDVSLFGLQRGIVLTDSDRNRILDNDLSSVWIAVGDGSDENVIRGNSVRAYEGFIAVGGSHNRVVDNAVASGDGVALGFGGHANRAARNTLSTDHATVVSIFGATGGEFVDNAISGRPGSSEVVGFRLTDSSGNLLARNAIGNVALGGQLISGADNVLRGNSLVGGMASERIVEDGLLVEAAVTGTELDRNTVSGFLDDGIDVEAPGTRLRRNRANDNGDLGIEAVPGVVDLGGNRAAGNGNPPQCLNVVCR